MQGFEREMERIRQNLDAQGIGYQEDAATNDELTSSARQLSALLSTIAHEVKSGDQMIEVDVTHSKAPGMVVGMLDAHFSTPRFIVKSTCTEQKVTVSIVDGKWVYAGNQLGLWGNWIDERVVFEDEFREDAIRSAIQAPFLNWYQLVKGNALPGIPLQ